LNESQLAIEQEWKRLARPLATQGCKGSFDYGCASLSRSAILAQDDRLRDLMDIADWRKKIDELDRRLVELLSERAQAAVEIGRLKRNTNLPIYEPERERIVFENVQEMNRGPLPGRDLVRIFERIMDVMRNIQKEGIGVKADGAKAAETELDSDMND
jgi:chorismate mutase